MNIHQSAFDALGSRTPCAAGPGRAQPEGGGRDDGRVPQDGGQGGRPLRRRRSRRAEGPLLAASPPAPSETQEAIVALRRQRLTVSSGRHALSGQEAPVCES